MDWEKAREQRRLYAKEQARERAMLFQGMKLRDPENAREPVRSPNARRERFIVHKMLAAAVGMDPSAMHNLIKRHGLDIPMAPGPGTNGQRTRLYSEAEAAVVFDLRQNAGFHTPQTLEELARTSRARW